VKIGDITIKKGWLVDHFIRGIFINEENFPDPYKF
jgi:hypothetical protein